jgi:large subunit ribosomal protein L28
MRASIAFGGRTCKMPGSEKLDEVHCMPRVCYFTGKKTRFGRKVTHRGKAKYLGGVGTKITGISGRKFKPNIQKVRAVVNGRVVRIKVSAKALRMGLVTKPPMRKYKPQPAATAA